MHRCSYFICKRNGSLQTVSDDDDDDARMSGTHQWRVASPASRDEWAMIEHLEPGRKYDIQVVTRSDFGESSGVIQVIVAGADPGQSLRHSFLSFTLFHIIIIRSTYISPEKSLAVGLLYP